MAALRNNGEAKRALTATPTVVMAHHRPDLTRGLPWALGTGRFLVVTIASNARQVDGTVFETPKGSRVIFVPAATRPEAAALGGTESRILAVRPSWSFPAQEWIAADPEFWTFP
jgi:hypothetical protein